MNTPKHRPKPHSNQTTLRHRAATSQNIPTQPNEQQQQAAARCMAGSVADRLRSLQLPTPIKSTASHPISNNNALAGPILTQQQNTKLSIQRSSNNHQSLPEMNTVDTSVISQTRLQTLLCTNSTMVIGHTTVPGGVCCKQSAVLTDLQPDDRQPKVQAAGHASGPGQNETLDSLGETIVVPFRVGDCGARRASPGCRHCPWR